MNEGEFLSLFGSGTTIQEVKGVMSLCFFNGYKPMSEEQAKSDWLDLIPSGEEGLDAILRLESFSLEDVKEWKDNVSGRQKGRILLMRNRKREWKSSL